MPLHHGCNQVKESFKVETGIPAQNVSTAQDFEIHVVDEPLERLRKRYFAGYRLYFHNQSLEAILKKRLNVVPVAELLLQQLKFHFGYFCFSEQPQQHADKLTYYESWWTRLFYPEELGKSFAADGVERFTYLSAVDEFVLLLGRLKW